MKRMALFTILVGLFFGTLGSASANLPPLQYYVRWATPIHYTCGKSSFGGYQLAVAETHLDYEVPNAAVMTELDNVNNSNGQSATSQDAESDWMNFTGTRAHTTYTIQSASYPITLQAVLKTYINETAVYQSTLSAKCTGNAHGSLSASVNNNPHPLNFGIWQEGNLTYTHP